MLMGIFQGQLSLFIATEPSLNMISFGVECLWSRVSVQEIYHLIMFVSLTPTIVYYMDSVPLLQL